MFGGMMRAPEQQNMVMLTEDRYLKPDATAVLAKITREEAGALLKVNSAGVAEFFKRKGCSELSQALGKEGINGETLSHLAPKYVEQLPVSLGDKLGLFAFMSRFRAAARSAKRTEVIWEGADFPTKLEKMMAAPCFDLLKACKCRGCCEMPRVFENLPPSSYKVTNTSFKKVGYAWQDEYPETKRYAVFKPRCGGFAGYERGRKWVYVEHTDNIDLSAVIDVDVTRMTFEAEKFTPTCMDKLYGYEKELVIAEPAKIHMTYTTPDGVTALLTMHISPEDPQKVADILIGAKEEAQAEDSGAGKVEM